MKKVLFLVNHDVVIYNFRRELVERLLDDGYEVIISSPYGKRINKLVAMGCKYEEIEINRHGTNPIKELELIRNYFKLFRKVRPDVVLTYTIKPNIYGGFVSRVKRIPYIANITGLGTAVEKPGIMQKITLLLYKIAFKNIHTIFFQNEENMNFFKQNNINTDVHKLLPGSGVNLEHFVPLPYPSNETIEFVFISRIMKEKGIDQYIDAAKHIREKYPFTRFHVCGFCEEEYESTLEDLEKKGILHYHGMIDDVREILKRTHCTVHPTYYPEGISNVLLESAACSRPLITTNRSGTREVVDNNVNGFLIKEKNVESLINAIDKFISLNNEERQHMGKLGREKVEEIFDRNIIIRSYLEELKNIEKAK